MRAKTGILIGAGLLLAAGAFAGGAMLAREERPRAGDGAGGAGEGRAAARERPGPPGAASPGEGTDAGDARARAPGRPLGPGVRSDGEGRGGAPSRATAGAGADLASAAEGDPVERGRRLRARGHLDAGSAHLAAGDPRSALSELVTAVELDPRTASAHALLGEAYYQLDDHERARLAWLDARDADAGLVEPLVGLGRIAYSEGRFEEAIERLEAALALAPSHAAAAQLLEKARKDSPLEARYREHWTQHFRIKVEGALDPRTDGEGLARTIGDLLESAYARVGATLAQYPTRTIPVVVYAERDFYEATGAHPWYGGIFDGKIRIPGKRAYGSDPALLASVCTHEYVHACIQSVAPRAPRWLHEGVAQVLEGKRVDVRVIAPTLAANEGPIVPGLDQLFRTARTSDSAGVVYEMSGSFAGFLFERFGAPAVAEMLRALGEGAPPDDAARRAFGASLETLDLEWRASLAR
jgi:tetratricopeptide (TPR) repeat protein